LTAPHVTTGGLCRWKALNKEGRHVGLDFYDLLISPSNRPRKSGLARSFTGAIERGEKDLRLTTLVKLANTFKISIGKLCT